MVSSGDCFFFSVDGENRVNSTVKSISKKAPSAKASSDECVFEICAEIDGHRQNATVTLYKASDGSRVIDVWIDGQTGDNLTHTQFHIPAVSYSSGSSASGNPVIKSPMPGKVIKLYFKEGDTVKAGESVVVIEAMKMEHVITAPCDGVVSLFCEEGLTVDDGAMLAEVGSKEE
jgi:acetyl-CoA/propionyl-CoA carboxylase biotin carboxyl carrier protein